MASRGTSTKPLTEQMMIKCTDAYMPHQASNILPWIEYRHLDPSVPEVGIETQ